MIARAARGAIVSVVWLALTAQAPAPSPPGTPAAPPPAAPAFTYYRWIDADGVVNYTQTPPPPGARLAPLVREAGVSPARAAEAPSVEAAPADQPWRRATDAGLEALRSRRFAEAEVRFREALREAARFPPDDPRLTTTLDYLSAAYLSEEKFALAEPPLRRWLALAEPALGPEHPLVGEIVMRLGTALLGQKKHAPAEPWLRRALAIAERTAGPDHPQTIGRVILLARLLTAQRRWTDAEPLHLRVIAALEKADPDGSLPGALVALGRFYETQRRWREAEAPYRRALAMLEADLGPEHLDLAALLEGLARVLRATGRPAEAAPLEARARAIRAGERSPRAGRALPPR